MLSDILSELCDVCFETNVKVLSVAGPVGLQA